MLFSHHRVFVYRKEGIWRKDGIYVHAAGIFIDFKRVAPLEESVTGNLVFDLVAYVLLVALGQRLCFRVNACSGGVDIIAKLIHGYRYEVEKLSW